MILEKIKAELTSAMKNKDKFLTQTLRSITAAIKQVEVDKRGTKITDDLVITILTKMVKQRQDSIDAFIKANRNDLVEIEQDEMEIIKRYLPEQLSEHEIISMIEDVIAAGGYATVKDLGKVIGELRPKLNGKADMGFVSAKVKELLS